MDMVIRQAFRSLLRAPAFSATAILTVALGIGVNTAIFGIIYAVLLDPLPYRDPARLVQLSETHPEFPSLQVAAPDYQDWRRMSKSFEDIAAYTFQTINQVTLAGAGEPEQVQATDASHQLFPMLGIQPIYGRAFTAEEEAGQAPVVMLNEALWRRKLSADPAVIGRTLRLGNAAYTVVGIVPKRQAYPAWADVWKPLSFMPQQYKDLRRYHSLELIGRLKRGVQLEQAQSEMQVIAAGLAKSYPETNKTEGASVLPLAASLTGEVRPALLIAWAAVSLVLLLACANVAHLVLIRSVARSREMAVRAALGANTFELMRVLVTEYLLLAFAGGALGAALAAFLLPLLAKFAAGGLPRLETLALTPVTAVFSGAAAVLCALLFALPALFHTRRTGLYEAIKQSSGLAAGHRRPRFGAAVIAVEVALAFVVMTGAGLLYRSFAALLREDAGFDARRVLAVDVSLSKGFAQAGPLFEQQIAPRLRRLPGVTSVAAANCAPLTIGSTELSRFATRFGVPGRVYEAGRFPVAQVRSVTPEYFRLLGIPLTRGRLLTDADNNQPVFLINETLARRFFPGQDPVGRALLMGVVSPSPQAIPIAGVVGDVRDLSLDLEPRPTIYQFTLAPRTTLLVSTAVDPASLIPAVREIVRSADAEAPITRLEPLAAIVNESLERRRFALYLLGAFAAMAGALTAIGIYGVIAYSVSCRGREFAIRSALGAQRRDLRSLVVRNFALPAGAGLIAGAGLAYVFARAMGTMLYKLSPADPSVAAITTFALAGLVIGSALRPAGKAASIPASRALRE
jgi:predicted permease